MTLTPRAIRALKLAETEACSLAHPSVGSQHLVLGLYALGGGMQFDVLSSLGLTYDSIRRAMMAMDVSAEVAAMQDGFLLGASARSALERAERGATLLSHTYVGTEHILVALLSEGEGGAARIFAAHGVDTYAVRQRIIVGCGWSAAPSDSGAPNPASRSNSP